MNNNQESLLKLKHKSFLMRPQERSDYKVKPARVLDVIAAVLSIAAAVLVWIYA